MSVVITRSLSLGDSDDYPLTHARIGYNKISGAVSASSAASGYDADYADNYLTYNFWKPSALPATWEITSSSIELVNYVGIAAHEVGSSDCAVYAEYFDGSDWVQLGATAPKDDAPIMFIFDQVAATRFRLRVTGSVTPRIGVVFFGKTLDMMRPIYGNHSPINLNRVTTLKTSISETGQFLGRTIRRRGVKTSYSWTHLKPDWYRAYFDPFVEHARTKPFFVAWRPARYPTEVGYVWTDSDIAPINSGIAGRMDVSISVLGLANE